MTGLLAISGPRRSTNRSEALRRAALAHDRSVPREPHQGRRRHSRPAERLLHRRRQRRRLEDDRLRPHLEPDLRRSADGLDRRDRDRAVESEHHLRRQRRRTAASRPLHRRRHLQVDRRRQDAGRTSVCATASRSRRSSSIRAIRIGCSSPCSAIRTGRTPSAASSARPTAARRFRKSYTRTRIPARIDVVLDPVESDDRLLPCSGKRVRGRGRTDSSPGRAADCSSRPTAARPGARSGRDCRPSSRTVSAASASPSRRACRAGCSRRWTRRATAASIAPTTPARTGIASTTGHARRGARVGLRRGEGRSEESGRRLHGERRDVEVDRRRQDVQGVSRRAGRRRLSSHLDQPERSEHHAHRQRSGRDRHGERRRDVELVVQSADGRVLSRHHRQRISRIASAAVSRSRARRASRVAATTGESPFCDWHPVGVEEYGYVAPDPLDPDIVYGGKVTRYDRRTGEVQEVAPSVGCGASGLSRRCARRRSSSRRSIRTRCSSRSNVVWKTINGGQSWTQISPDLTRTDSIVPANVGEYAAERGAAARHPGVVYTIAPSYVDARRHLGRAATTG